MYLLRVSAKGTWNLELLDEGVTGTTETYPKFLYSTDRIRSYVLRAPSHIHAWAVSTYFVRDNLKFKSVPIKIGDHVKGINGEYGIAHSVKSTPGYADMYTIVFPNDTGTCIWESEIIGECLPDGRVTPMSKSAYWSLTYKNDNQ